MVAMTFDRSFKVELWNPCYNSYLNKTPSVPDTRMSRQLVCSQAFFRKYTPLRSGDSKVQLHDPVGTMVALLVPTRFRPALTYIGDRLDVGMTLLRTMEMCAPDEFTMELGGQTFALSYEIHLAKMERDMSRTEKPLEKARPLEKAEGRRMSRTGPRVVMGALSKAAALANQQHGQSSGIDK